MDETISMKSAAASIEILQKALDQIGNLNAISEEKSATIRELIEQIHSRDKLIDRWKSIAEGYKSETQKLLQTIARMDSLNPSCS